MRLLYSFVLIFLVASTHGYGQPETDSLPLIPRSSLTIAEDSEPPAQSSWGVDVLISTNGFGLGTFYRHEYNRDIAGFMEFSISEAKDDEEVEFIDPYTGQSFVPGKINRFLILPLFFGVQRRLFRDQILDNFRPYISAAAGPTMLYVFPYNTDYFSALGKGQPRYTGAGYIGVGAYFGQERSNVLSLNLRYYYIPFPAGIESFRRGSYIATKTQYGGFYITLSFGNAW